MKKLIALLLSLCHHLGRLFHSRVLADRLIQALRGQFRGGVYSYIPHPCFCVILSNFERGIYG